MNVRKIYEFESTSHTGCNNMISIELIDSFVELDIQHKDKELDNYMVKKLHIDEVDDIIIKLQEMSEEIHKKNNERLLALNVDEKNVAHVERISK